MRTAWLVEYRLGQLEFTEYAQKMLNLPKDAICECGCERECHGHCMGIVGLGRCGKSECKCHQFVPATEYHI